MRALCCFLGALFLVGCGDDGPAATGYLIDADDGYVVCAEQVPVCPSDTPQTAFRGFAVADISSIEFIDIDGVRVSASRVDAIVDDVGLEFSTTEG